MTAIQPLPREPLAAQLLEVLRSPEFRKGCIQRLVAATLDAAEGFRAVENAVERVLRETRGPDTNLAGRLLHAVDASCAMYAELRGLPYKRIFGPLSRLWVTLMSRAAQAGLTEEEAYAVMRDLFRKKAAFWSQLKAKDLEHELHRQLRYGFVVVGITKGPRDLAREELRHAFRRGR